MKNLYLIETNARTMLVLHDTDDKTATVLDTFETNSFDFTFADVEDVSAGEIFEDVEELEEWLGIDYNDPETPRIIHVVENWEG